jgi:hypothetical protein
VPECPQTGVVTMPLGAPNLIVAVGRDAFVTNRPPLTADRFPVAIHLFVFMNPCSHLPHTLSAQQYTLMARWLQFTRARRYGRVIGSMKLLVVGISLIFAANRSGIDRSHRRAASQAPCLGTA